jgi:hypothetical protein
MPICIAQSIQFTETAATGLEKGCRCGLVPGSIFSAFPARTPSYGLLRGFLDSRHGGVDPVGRNAALNNRGLEALSVISIAVAPVGRKARGRL